MIRTRPAAVLAAALSLAAPPLAAQERLADDVRVRDAIDLAELWLETQRQYDRIPGLSAAVVHDQELVWSDGFGYADVEAGRPATAETIYSICSISKLFTSIALMQRRDAGRVRLDDPVSDHLDWFAIEETYPDAGPARVEALLTHSAGLPRESDFPYWSAPEFDFPTQEEIRRRVKEQRALYPAETYFQYSNLGLTLAGEIVEAASGQPFAAYVRRSILDPLGLDDTYPEIPEAHRGSRLATGYSRRMPDGERTPVPFYLVRGIAPAAGFASTVEDLARFASWQFRLLEEGGEEVLRANTLREMHRVHWVDPDFETTWGLGFAVDRSDGKTFVGHGGACPGYRSQLLTVPAEEIAVTFAGNGNDVNSGLFARRLYDIFAPALKQAAGEDEAKPRMADADRYTGLYRGFWGDNAVVAWKGGLATVSLPSMNPMESLTELRKTGEHTFRRVREDGELGEEIRFDMGPDGRALRVWQHSNPLQRVR